MTTLADQLEYASTTQLDQAYPNVFTKVGSTEKTQAIVIASNDIDKITKTTWEAHPDTDGYINRLCLVLAAIEIVRGLLADADEQKLEDYTFNEVKKLKELLEKLGKERDRLLRGGGYVVPSEEAPSVPSKNQIARGRGWKRRENTDSTTKHVPTSRW